MFAADVVPLRRDLFTFMMQRKEGDPNKPLSVVNLNWHVDKRIDPRIRNFFAKQPFSVNSFDEYMVPLLNSDELAGGETLAPSEGLQISVEEIISQPDGNKLKVSVMKKKAKKETDRPMPCVIYYHGGGMSHYSCFYSCWQTLSRLLAHAGLVVIMPDFRNSNVPSLEGEPVAKFPGGLNDCVSTLHWVHSASAKLGIDSRRVTIAGESGGGNLAIATALTLKQRGQLELIYGLYVLCPYLAGLFPQDMYPSSSKYAGIFMDFNASLGTFRSGKYDGVSRNLHGERNKLAWPDFCEERDLAGFPECVVVVNEFDPLRDEGIAFYRKCLGAGVRAQCRILAGTTHGVGSYLPGLCPEVTIDQARSMAQFAAGGSIVTGNDPGRDAGL